MIDCADGITAAEKFEKAALFLQLGLPSKLIRYVNGAFQKRFLNRKNLKTPSTWRFNVDRKRFENGVF